MVRGLVQHQDIGAVEHHPGEHAADLLAAGEHLHRLVDIVPGEEHPPQEGAQEGLGVVRAVLGEPLHEILAVVVKEGRVIQWEVTGGDGGAPLVAALVRLQLAHEDLEEGGLGQLVLPHEGDLIAFVHPEADVVQHLAAIHGLSEVLHGEDLLARLPIHGEAHEGVAAGGHGDLLQADLLQELPPGGGLLALGLVGGEAGDELLQLLDLILLAAVLVPDEPLHQLAGLIPEIVVAHVHFDPAVVHIHDAGADGVQEVAVVAHHQHQALVVHEEILQPLDGREVQVVGGLVQEDDVWLSKEGLGQEDLHLFLGGKAGHGVVEDALREAQSLDEAAGVGLRLPAAHLGVLGLQLAGPDAVLVGEVGLFVEGVLLPLHFIEPGIAQDDGVQHRVGIVLEVVLLQDAHALVVRDDDLAGGGLQFPGEDAQEGGLARAVGPDDAVAVAGGELQVHVLEEGLAAEVEAQIVDNDHGGFLSCG